MRFHYALVDDLLPEAEFEERVEAKAAACGGLVDEPTAAMLVVGDLGRAHRKVSDLLGKASLVLFFGRVLTISGARTFVRADGEEGRIATLTLGDETGRVEVALFDEKADAIAEIEVGEVLEVIARPSTRRRSEVTALALQKANCEVDCQVPPGGGAAGTPGPDALAEIVVRVLTIRVPRSFTRRDGTQGTMIEALVGDGDGVFRLVAWQPGLLDDLSSGAAIRVTNLEPGRRTDRREFSIDEGSTVEPVESAPEVGTMPLGTLPAEGTVSIRGDVRVLRPPRQFIARSGEPSWVRNLVVGDETGEVPVVLWGDHALLPIAIGDRIEVYGGTLKPGRYGDIEVSAGWSAGVLLPSAGEVAVTIEGTVLETPAGFFIDDGHHHYLLDGGSFRMGDEIRVEGRLLGNRLVPDRAEPATQDSEAVRRRLENLPVFPRG